jgi:Reverse transcriptase (RNA-dependent DNA polymerase)
MKKNSYAFDRWMAKHHPDVPFERFADDAVCHCSSEYQARRLQAELERRFAECGLALHSDKTQIDDEDELWLGGNCGVPDICRSVRSRFVFVRPKPVEPLFFLMSEGLPSPRARSSGTSPA